MGEIRPRALGACVAMLLAAAARPEALPSINVYFPSPAGLRLSYVTRAATQFAPEQAMHWELVHQRSAPLAEGGQRVTFVARTAALEGAPSWQRQERYVVNGRGVYPLTPDGDQDAYGPLPVLPDAASLEERDTLWRYDGPRQLSMGFRLLGLMRASDRIVQTSMHYHVLRAEPVETPAGTFAQAVEVTLVGRLKLDLPRGLTWLMVRGRQWLVPGVGLVRETLEFPDVPPLGQLTTELTSYTGAVALEREQLARLAAEEDADAA